MYVSSLNNGVPSFCLGRSLHPWCLKLICVFFLLPLSFHCKLSLNQRILSNVVTRPYLRELWWVFSIMRSGVSTSWELFGVDWPKFWSFMSWNFLKWTHISGLQRKTEVGGREYNNLLLSCWLFFHIIPPCLQLVQDFQGLVGYFILPAFYKFK